MRYGTRKIILCILALGFFLAAPAYAGTGPATDSAVETTHYFTASISGNTTTIEIFYNSSTLPACNVAWQGSAQPVGNDTENIPGWYPLYPNDGPWYGGEYITQSGSWNTTNSTIYKLPQTTGTISVLWLPVCTNPSLGLTATSSPPGIMQGQQIGYTSSSNWNSSYWDIDEIVLTGGEGSSEQSFIWVNPIPFEQSSSTIDAPTNFILEDLNWREDGYEYRIFFEIYGITTTTLKYSYGTTWSESTDIELTQQTIAGVPFDLYVRSSSQPYNVLARLQERETGTFIPNTIDEEWIYFIVDAPQNTSSITVKPKPLPTSSVERASVYQDCGGWNEFQLGCHLENFTVYLFIPDFTIPNSEVVSPLVIVWTEYFTVFPFSIFSVYKENFEEQASAINENPELNLSLTIASNTISIPIAGRDFLVDQFGSENTNTYYNWFIGALATAVVLAMINGIIKTFF